MKFIPLVWAPIRRKLSRSILVFAQVIVGFALFDGALQGLTTSVNRPIAVARADRLYVASKLDQGEPRSAALSSWRLPKYQPANSRRAPQ
jgi:hypothetical protein